MPPSPIPSVIFPVYFLMPSVTIDFYVGEQRQHTTPGALVAISKKNFSLCVSAVCKDTPSMTSIPFYLLNSFNYRTNSISSSMSRIVKISSAELFNPVDIAMHVAVSTYRQTVSVIQIHCWLLSHLITRQHPHLDATILQALQCLRNVLLKFILHTAAERI